MSTADSPYRASAGRHGAAPDPEHRRRVRFALVLLFWARLGGALTLFVGGLSMRLVFELSRSGLVGEFFGESIWPVRVYAHSLCELVVIAALGALTRSMHWSPAGIAVRVACVLSICVWCADFYWSIFGAESYALQNVMRFVGFATTASLVIALRALRLLVADPTEAGRPASPWLRIELSTLAFVGLVRPLLWLLLWLTPTFPHAVARLMPYVHIFVQAASDVLVLLVIRATGSVIPTRSCERSPRRRRPI